MPQSTAERTKIQKALSKAQHLLNVSHDAQPDNYEYRRDQAQTMELTGDLHRLKGDQAAALSSYREAQEIRANLADQDPSSLEWKVLYAQGALRLLSHLGYMGLDRSAGDDFEQAITRLQSATTEGPQIHAFQVALADACERFGDWLSHRGDLIQCENMHRQALRLREALRTDKKRDDWRINRDISSSYERLGDCLRGQPDRADEAAECYSTCLNRREFLLTIEPSHRWESQWLAMLAHARLADFYVQKGSASKAREHSQRFIEFAEERARNNSGDDGRTHYERASAWLKRAEALMLPEVRLIEAKSAAEKSVEFFEKLESQKRLPRDDADRQCDYGKALCLLGVLQRQTGETEKGDRSLERGIKILEAVEERGDLRAHDQRLLEQWRALKKSRR
jgi:tetratricopeptide (TPR) repeat protein